MQVWASAVRHQRARLEGEPPPTYRAERGFVAPDRAAAMLAPIGPLSAVGPGDGW